MKKKQQATYVRVRMDVAKRIDEISYRYRIGKTDIISVLLEAFESLSESERMSIIVVDKDHVKRVDNCDVHTNNKEQVA